MGLQGGLHTGEVCGALSGGVLAVGLLYGEDEPEAVAQVSERFIQRFAKTHGAVRCADIIGFSFGSIKGIAGLRSLRGLLRFGLRGGPEVCNQVVGDAVELLLQELEEREA